MTNTDPRYLAAERFVHWLEDRLALAGRGDNETALDVEPSGKYWLGRLASEEHVVNMGMAERGERLEPCAVGVVVKPLGTGLLKGKVMVSACAWSHANNTWSKTRRMTKNIEIAIDTQLSSQSFGNNELSAAFSDLGLPWITAEIRVEIEVNSHGETEMAIMLVNTSPMTTTARTDTRLYECSLCVSGIPTAPFVLESLPDSFRYDRLVPAYGVNCGVEIGSDGSFTTVDTVGVSRARPIYWGSEESAPDLTFSILAENPLLSVQKLVDVLRNWGTTIWSDSAIADRAKRHNWTKPMIDQAKSAAKEFQIEYKRIESGAELLKKDSQLLHAFKLMNEAMLLSSNGKYDSWRPFQMGFLLANLACIIDPDAESGIVDIVWFATGGGKTETYLGLLITAALYDRLRGKITGITAWSRFPLRMLSLQQMQRFANAIAAAEIMRRKARIGGDAFSLGFLVGDGATPNSIKESRRYEGDWDADDDDMPAKLQLLQRCPFCHGDTISMAFNRRLWKLEHRCTSDTCPWPDEALPFYIVDDELFRFLPTIVVGTLDKAASIARQAAMRGFVGSPRGMCPRDGHGFVYAARGGRPHGCLVPGCNVAPQDLPMDKALFGLSFRLQDELHLLKDSLGAVDAHYEALYDGLQRELCGKVPKILASSATLEGFKKQSDVLYRRDARVFPQQGPSIREGFWSTDSKDMMRRYVAVAPRGVTIEYTVDRLLTELQNSIRRLIAEPEAVCKEIGIDPIHAPFLILMYGTHVVYGNTLRDLDAVERSIGANQVQVDGYLNAASLTGRTDFKEVKEILDRLEAPEEQFLDRIHVITASSMMSHGVDIDRLNVMVMLGLPLTTAEFIQSSARVGRKWPGLVLVVHKIGRERDAGIYRSFKQFVEQGDRFVEPVPVTRRSRRVLEKTLAGLVAARILMIHEANSGARLVTLTDLRNYMRDGGYSVDQECKALLDYLGLDKGMDHALCSDMEDWLSRFARNVRDPINQDMKFTSQACPTGEPMLSLRDVEEQVRLFLERGA